MFMQDCLELSFNFSVRMFEKNRAEQISHSSQPYGSGILSS